MKPVQVIGMGASSDDLGRRHLNAVAAADLLVGGRRHLASFADHPARKLEITAPLSGVIEEIRQAMAREQVVVLASGDPMFFGIGKTLIEHLGEDHVEIHPNISIMAEAFARIKKPWADAAVVSLHGRDAEAVLPAMLAEAKPLFVLTDPRRTPAKVAQIVAEKASDRWRICVFERLGQSDERLSWCAPADAVNQKYREPNAVVLWPMKSADPFPKPLPGGADEEFAHERGMITKCEIRAVVLAKLRPEPDHVMWDLGAGSGAVAIEAAAIIIRGSIIAVEKNPGRVCHIRKNIRKFGTSHVDVRECRMPEALASLPDPDRIFVGGGGKNLPEILRISAERLRPGGRIVVTLVVVESLAACLKVFKEIGFDAEVVQIQVGKGTDMPGGTRFEANNPVFIVSAEKKQPQRQ